MPLKTIEVPTRKSIILRASKNDSTIDAPDYLLIELTQRKATRLLAQREIVDSISDPALRAVHFEDHQAHWFLDYKALHEDERVQFDTRGVCIAPDGWVPQWTGDTGEPTEIRTGSSVVEIRKDTDPLWITSGPATGERVTSAFLPWKLIVAVAAGQDVP